MSDVLEQVKVIQLQNVDVASQMSTLVSLPTESDDISKPEQLVQWSQLLCSGITLNVPFSVAVSGETFRYFLYLVVCFSC